MQNELWMQPALQPGEAVLLPALERSTFRQPRFGGRMIVPSSDSDAFMPVHDTWPDNQSLALSTYVRPRGSMAGRSVLRAAGVPSTPFGIRTCCPRRARMNSSRW